MKDHFKLRGNAIRRFVVILIALGTISVASVLSGAHAPTTSVTIVNNSSNEIRHIFLSPTNQDSWGPDQLAPSTISTGGTFTIGSVSCSAADIKVIAEDADGCFFYKVVTCGQSTTWTITNDSGRDCG